MVVALYKEAAQHLLPTLCLAPGNVIHSSLSWEQNTSPKNIKHKK